jgi:hypothetical protein
MRNSPSIVPDPENRDIYLVLDDFRGRLGRAWPHSSGVAKRRSTQR